MMQPMPSSPVLLGAFPAFDVRHPDPVIDAIKTNFHQADVDIPKTRYFRVCYNFVDLGGVSLHWAHFSSGFQIVSEPDPTDMVLLRLFRGELCLSSGRERFSAVPGRRAALLDFNHRTIIYQEKGYDNISTRFIRARVEDALFHMTGINVATPLSFAPAVDLCAPGPRRMLNVLDRVVGLLCDDPGIIDAPLLVAQCEEFLVTALLTCLPHNHSRHFRQNVMPAPSKIVRLAEAYIEANADKPLRMADVSKAVGMCSRSIQAAFQKDRGYSPSYFLRECRLANARQALRHASPGDSVLSIVLANGFSSHSAFSRLYRERYGENPSETLRKNA